MKKPTTFNIGGVPEHFNIPIRKAIDEGIFTSQNIDLKWHDYKGGTGDLVKGLAEKSIDIGVLLSEGAIKATIEKQIFTIVQVYINTPLFWGVYTGQGSSIRSISSDILPKFLISRYGSGSHLMAYLYCKEHDIDLKSIEFKEVGNFQGAISAFESDPNCLFLWERFMTKPSVDSGIIVKLDEIPTPWASFSFVVRNDILETNEAEIIEFLKSISDFTYKFKQNTLDSIDYISNYFDFSVNDMKQWIQTTDWNYFLDRPQLKLMKAFQFLKEMKLIDASADLSSICPSDEFWEKYGL